MYTTIKVSEKMRTKLEKMKLSDSESYEDVIEDLIEDRLALNKEFVETIEQRRSEIKKGKFVTLGQLKKEMK